jgi:hypothetical protein
MNGKSLIIVINDTRKLIFKSSEKASVESILIKNINNLAAAGGVIKQMSEIDSVILAQNVVARWIFKCGNFKREGFRAPERRSGNLFCCLAVEC